MQYMQPPPQQQPVYMMQQPTPQQVYVMAPPPPMMVVQVRIFLPPYPSCGAPDALLPIQQPVYVQQRCVFVGKCRRLASHVCHRY